MGEVKILSYGIRPQIRHECHVRRYFDTHLHPEDMIVECECGQRWIMRWSWETGGKEWRKISRWRSDRIIERNGDTCPESP